MTALIPQKLVSCSKLCNFGLLQVNHPSPRVLLRFLSRSAWRPDTCTYASLQRSHASCTQQLDAARTMSNPLLTLRIFPIQMIAQRDVQEGRPGLLGICWTDFCHSKSCLNDWFKDRLYTPRSSLPYIKSSLMV